MHTYIAPKSTSESQAL